MRIFVTGANGFVGRALIKYLLSAGHSVVAGLRNHSAELPDEVEQNIVGDFSLLDDKNTLKVSLKNIDVVVHTAARVHVMKDRATDPLSEFRKVNTNATMIFARAAADAGIKRFIFLSSIKVNGESTPEGVAFSEEDVCNPTDPYALSKWEAEQGLMELADKTEMDVVVIRLPLIYGPGVKGNFASMIKLVNKGIPLPLRRVNNRRSLLALDNLVNFIIYCLEHPKAANQVFLLSDGKDVSIVQLIRCIAYIQGKSANLLPVPTSWINFLASLLGRRDVADRLLGSLSVNISKARSLLGWEPVVSMEQQLKKD